MQIGNALQLDKKQHALQHRIRIQEQSNTHNQRNDQLQISPAILTGTRHFPPSLENQTKPRRNLFPARSPGSKLSHPHTPQLSGISTTTSN